VAQQPCRELASYAPAERACDVALPKRVKSMVAVYLFDVSLGMHFPLSTARQPVEAIALEDTGDRCAGDFDPSVSRQIPDDPDRAEVVLAAKMKDLLLNLDRYSIGMPLWNFWPVHESGITVLPMGLTSTVEAAASDANISTGLGDMTGFFRAINYEACARSLVDPCS
jgi:hypothetical protein